MYDFAANETSLATLYQSLSSDYEGISINTIVALVFVMQPTHMMQLMVVQTSNSRSGHNFT